MMERQNCVGSAVLCRDVGAKRYSGVFLSQIVVGCTRYHQFNTIQYDTTINNLPI